MFDNVYLLGCFIYIKYNPYSEFGHLMSRFVSSARQLAKALEVPLVNELGYTKRYIRCLQVIYKCGIILLAFAVLFFLFFFWVNRFNCFFIFLSFLLINFSYPKKVAFIVFSIIFGLAEYDNNIVANPF